MHGRMLTTAGAMAFGLLIAAPFAPGAPNQGDASKVLTADNPAVSCQAPVALPKVEGAMPASIHVEAGQRIDSITLKSGRSAVIVSASFGQFSADVTLSKDVSNYVVWVCPEDAPPPGDEEVIT